MSFWDQVKSGMGRAAAEAEKQAHIARLNIELHGVKGNIRRKVEEMGEVTLGLYRKGELNHPSIGSIVEEIANLEGRVAELEKKIEEVRTTPTTAS